MPENNRKIPKYQIIENDIIDKINTGIYSTNDSLPTELELSEKYQCSRVTVRQALSNLAYRGYIIKNQGSGSYVNKSNTIQRTPIIKSFTEEMDDLGKTASSKVLTFNITTAGSTMANILGIHENDQIYYIERIRFADGMPMLFEKTFMAIDLHPEISLKVLQGSKYRYAEEHGFTIDWAYQNIAPIYPPDYIAQELKISTNQSILRVANTTYTPEGIVFDYTELYLNTEVYQLNIIKRR
ncbi:GntR family transcriptional regulator [Anaerorhabdus sp.]|uniref:GntR family transcriptional regulator n=1 Tax=Anaerorhabdus sp. TaxID=1872524 RepID=UPI002FC73D6A